MVAALFMEKNYFRRLLFFAASITFFASSRFLVFFELARCPVIQLPLFAIGVGGVRVSYCLCSYYRAILALCNATQRNWHGNIKRYCIVLIPVRALKA